MLRDNQPQQNLPVLEDAEQSIRLAKRTGTFTDNMKLPIHRWFRYSAGFSNDWVREVIQENAALLNNGILLDPFVGSGTTILAAEQEGAHSIGIEAHSFIYRIAKAKLCWESDPDSLVHMANTLVSLAQNVWEKTDIAGSPALLLKCYEPENLMKLEALRLSFLENYNPDNSGEEKLLWLALTSILRECSGVGTAQWQYVLPNKSKKKVLDPFFALRNKIQLFSDDIIYAQKTNFTKSGQIYQCDSRSLKSVPDNSVSMVITSPPYPNNYDYADSTRLELSFWREIEGWGDLHEHIRKYLVTSCSQHSAKNKIDLDVLLKNEALDPIRSDIETVCKKLSEVRRTKGGKKTYHTMVASYFIDMSLTWKRLRSVCKEGARVCFVIGDSAPYGVYVPVDEWMGKLAISAGFKAFSFEKIRDRNIKWKNRKHRVPLKEGNLWVEG